VQGLVDAPSAGHRINAGRGGGIEEPTHAPHLVQRPQVPAVHWDLVVHKGLLGDSGVDGVEVVLGQGRRSGEVLLEPPRLQPALDVRVLLPVRCCRCRCRCRGCR
jgi:hypothetical protein